MRRGMRRSREIVANRLAAMTRSSYTPLGASRAIRKSSNELRHVERWPQPFHAVRLCDFRIHWLLAREGEEIFHLASRREPHQHPSRLLTDVGPHMGHIPWREYGIAGPKREALVAYLDYHLVALNEVEPFFLCIVQMAHWPALRNIAML